MGELAWLFFTRIVLPFALVALGVRFIRYVIRSFNEPMLVLGFLLFVSVSAIAQEETPVEPQQVVLSDGQMHRLETWAAAIFGAVLARIFFASWKR